jgi:SAM-dependent methyltransferase
VRVRVRGRGPLSEGARGSAPELPPPELLRRQAERLAPLRSRLLRRLRVAHRGPVLDLGAGYGAVTEELVRRARGPVFALDRRVEALRGHGTHAGAHGVAGEAQRLPFRDRSFGLLIAQNVFLWIRDVDVAAREAARVLAPGGALVLIEPDYGGLIEYPEELALAPIWRAALRRAGADPLVGRRLPSALRAAGLEVTIDLLGGVTPDHPDRFALLEGLALEPDERAQVERARRRARALGAGEALVHLPYVFVTGARR